jgi:8-oxo-dGTP pyrophosphatase MutT (NUDIX family)
MRMSLYQDALDALADWQPEDDRSAIALPRTLELLRFGPAVMERAHAPGHVTASAMIVHSDRERVLLCLHGKFNMWCQVGGHCEPEDTTLASAAFREATEESGIPGLILDPRPINIDIHAVRCTVGPTHHYDVRFALLAPPDAAEQVSFESHALGWFRPDELPSPMAEGTESAIGPALKRFKI